MLCRRLHPLILALLLAAGGVSGCAERVPEAVRDGWHHAPDAAPGEYLELPPFVIFPVREGAVAEAEKELDAYEFIQISPAMADHFSGQEIGIPTTLRPFLFRGLSDERAHFKVRQSPTSLWIVGSGDQSGNIQRRPVVVLIDPQPQELFVTVE